MLHWIGAKDRLYEGVRIFYHLRSQNNLEPMFSLLRVSCERTNYNKTRAQAEAAQGHESLAQLFYPTSGKRLAISR